MEDVTEIQGVPVTVEAVDEWLRSLDPDAIAYGHNPLTQAGLGICATCTFARYLLDKFPGHLVAVGTGVNNQYSASVWTQVDKHDLDLYGLPADLSRRLLRLDRQLKGYGPYTTRQVLEVWDGC
jgi:hypothetical protein